MAVVVAVVAAAGGGAYWWADSSASPGQGARGTSFETPNLAPDDVSQVFIASGLARNPLVRPWSGITVNDESGTAYVHDGWGWSALGPDGSLWLAVDRRVDLYVDGETVDASSVPDEDRPWVEPVLVASDGVEGEWPDFTVEEQARLSLAIRESAEVHEAWAAPIAPDRIELARRVRNPIVWVQREESHSWIVDNYSAVLAVHDDNGSRAVGGFFLHGSDVGEPDDWSGPRVGEFQREPFVDADTQALLDFVRSQIETWATAAEAEARSDRTQAPESQDQLPPVIVVSSNSGSSLGVTAIEVQRRQGFADGACGAATTFEECVRSSVSPEFQACVDRISSGQSSCDTPDDSGFALGTVGDVLEDVVGYDDFMCTVGQMFCGPARAVEWVEEDMEMDCGTMGPGPPEGQRQALVPGHIESELEAAEEADFRTDPPLHQLLGLVPAGGEPTRVYPRPGYGLEGIVTVNVDDWQERLDLARSWMPLIELSKQEQCGEIMRIFAKLHPYTAEGGRANSLEEAVRVEIAYTLFFRQDGGRFKITAHPGDNEGFVIALTRTEHADGLCSTGFEFASGRTVAHSRASWWDVFKFNALQIDDFNSADVGTSCPDGGVRDDNGWRVLVSEQKHGIYYHRDGAQSPQEGTIFPDPTVDPDNTTCEAALAPLIGFVGNIIAPGLGLSVDQWKSRLSGDLRDGLEECESNSLQSASHLVELYDESLSGAGLEFDTLYQTHEGPRTFAEQARGQWCFPEEVLTGRQEGGSTVYSSPVRPFCNREGDASGDAYNYHVPGFFGFPTAREPGPSRDGTITTTAVSEVPYLMDLTASQAQKEINEADFIWREGTRPVDDPTKHGLVVAQSPLPGTSHPTGSPVTYWLGVHAGDELVTVAVPDVVGQTLDSARSEIEGLELVYDYGGLFELSESEAGLDGVVARQAPDPGSPVEPGTIVTVYLGSYPGEEVVVVATPDVYKQSPSAAESAIEGIGLVFVDGGTVPTDDPSEGGVSVSQTPSAGTPLQEGSTVTVYFGDYTPTSGPVPNVVGLSESSAVSQIESAGFVANRAGTEVDPYHVGEVISQDPGPGGSLTFGSTVGYSIGVAPSFPAQHLSSVVDLFIQGSGHGGIHSLGETISFSVSWSALGGAEQYFEWVLFDEALNTEFASEPMGEGGALAPAATRILSGPIGLRRFALEVWELTGSGWVKYDEEDLWIWVEG